jgi:hypothetical protein
MRGGKPIIDDDAFVRLDEQLGTGGEQPSPALIEKVTRKGGLRPSHDEDVRGRDSSRTVNGGLATRDDPFHMSVQTLDMNEERREVCIVLAVECEWPRPHSCPCPGHPALRAGRPGLATTPRNGSRRARFPCRHQSAMSTVMSPLAGSVKSVPGELPNEGHCPNPWCAHAASPASLPQSVTKNAA